MSLRSRPICGYDPDLDLDPPEWPEFNCRVCELPLWNDNIMRDGAVLCSGCADQYDDGEVVIVVDED